MQGRSEEVRVRPEGVGEEKELMNLMLDWRGSANDFEGFTCQTFGVSGCGVPPLRGPPGSGTHAFGAHPHPFQAAEFNGRPVFVGKKRQLQHCRP